MIYAPLDCNADMETSCTKLFTSLLNGSPSQDVTVPCGECYKISANSVIDLSSGGINILGKLSVGDDANSNQAITVTAGYIYVQGELHIVKRQKISGTTKDDIKFVLTGSTDKTFNSHDVTKQSLNVGQKPIVVAGGKLNIDALPNSCETWKQVFKVQGNSATTLPAPTVEEPPAACDAGTPGNRAIVDEDFESGSFGGWSGNLGASRSVEDDDSRRLRGRNSSRDKSRRLQVFGGDDVEASIESHGVDSNNISSDGNRKLGVTGSYLRISGRTREWQGPRIDLLSLRPCLLPNVIYLFTAKFRLFRPDGEPSNCSQDTGNCLRITTKYTNNHDRHITKARMRGGQAVPDGEWFDFSAKFSFDTDETNPNSHWEIIEIVGPEAGVEIHMDDVKFTLPPVESYSQNCENIAPSVENPFAALSGGHPYPLRSNRVGYADESRGILRNGDGEYSPILYKTEDDPDSPDGKNTFITQTGRWDDWASLTFDIPTGCAQPFASYRAMGRFRLHTDEVHTNVRMEIVAWDANGNHFTLDMGHCPPMGGPNSNTTWVTCAGGAAFTERHTNARRIEWRLRTRSARYADVDYDDLTFDFVGGSVDGVVVEDADHAVRKCWDEGAEIMITTHTLDYNDEQLTTITGVAAHPTDTDKTVVLIDGVNAPIAAMPSKSVDGDMAVEVALTSRSVVFDTAASDLAANSKLGAHLMVYNTPGVEQTLIGAEFRNMGQRAKKKRFPIYFHMSSADESNSIISKNLVRDSQFRCIVLHGMSNLTVSHNVAYNTFGHCYMLDSGYDIGNAFTSNLAAKVKRSQDWLSGESDNHWPAAYWISNVRNSFIGNVAAGSERNGFLIDPIAPRGDANSIPGRNRNTDRDKFGVFRGNVAHGIYENAIKVERYYNQIENGEAVLEDNKVHFNVHNGIYIHNSYNIAFEGGHVSDHRTGIVNDRSDNIRVTNVDITGTSHTFDFYYLFQRARFHHVICPSNYHTQVGFRTHSMVNYYHKWIPGHKIEKVRFSGFNENGCTRSAGYAFHTSHSVQHYNQFAQFVTTSSTDKSFPFDFCGLADVGIDDVVFNDLDGALNPASGSVPGTPGVVITNTPKMTAMLGDKTCTEYSEWCVTYCEDSCLRTVTIHTPRDVDNLQFHVTDENDPDGPEVVVEVSKEFYRSNGEPNTYENTKHYRKSLFAVSLPAGNFRGVFKDKTTGLVVRPGHMEVIYEPAPDCGGLAEGGLVLDYPVLDDDDEYCNDLVFNGNAETGNWTHWGHVETSVNVDEGTGVDGSYALTTGARDSSYKGLSTFLKNDCLKAMVGMELEVIAYFHLENGAGEFGANPYECDPSGYDGNTNYCPSGKLVFYRDDDYTTNTLEKNWIGRAVHPVNVTGYTMIHKVFTVTQDMAEYDRTMFYVAATKRYKRIFLDNVSIKPFDRPGQSPVLRNAGFGECQELILNGDLESGTTENWLPRDRDAISLVEGESGGYAIKSYRRSRGWYGAMQNLKPSCIQPGKEYEIFAKFKLEKSGDTIVCDQSRNWGDLVCPTINMEGRSATDAKTSLLARTVDVGSNTEWGTINGVFEATDFMGNALSNYIFFNANSYVDILIDDVYMRPWFKDCSNIVQNGDLEIGTALFWTRHHTGVVEIIPGGYDDSDFSLKMSGRTDIYGGLKQELGKDCAIAGDYRISLKVRLEADGVSQECDHEKYRTVNSCPVATFRAEGDHTVERDIAMTVGEHDGDFWYDIDGVFTISTLEEALDRNYIIISYAGANVDIIIDNVQIVLLDETV